MLRTIPLTGLTLVSALLLLLGACGSSDDDNSGGTGPTLPAEDFAGTWLVTAEVVSKRTCDNTVGQEFQQVWSVGQFENEGLVLFAGVPIALSINGDRATGTGQGDATYQVQLEVDSGALSGTLTLSRSNPACTEEWTLTGSRMDDPPPAGFAGSWDLETEIVSGNCLDDPIGTVERFCRTVGVNGNRIWIDDPDGAIVGARTGADRATFWRVETDDLITIEVSFFGDLLTGTIYSQSLTDECMETAFLDGERRESACPEPPSIQDLAGGWYVEPNRSTSIGCFLDVEDWLGLCVSVTANGSEIVVDDGSGRGILTGEIEGSYAVVRRDDVDGSTTLRLTLEEGRLVGDGLKLFTGGDCEGTEFTFEFDGDALPLPCNQSGGPFDGSWDVTEVSRDNGCEFPMELDPCVRIFQNGNQVFLVDGDGDGGGTVSGNTVTVRTVEESVEIDLRFITETTVEVFGGGTSIAATLSVTLQSISNPSESCTSTLSITGVPAAEPCPIDFFKAGGEDPGVPCGAGIWRCAQLDPGN